jgi:hypothetical protein
MARGIATELLTAALRLLLFAAALPAMLAWLTLVAEDADCSGSWGEEPEDGEATAPTHTTHDGGQDDTDDTDDTDAKGAAAAAAAARADRAALGRWARAWSGDGDVPDKRALLRA